jgi:apolipoprotein N-acyltransferase
MAQQGVQTIAVPSLDAPEIADKHYRHLVFRAIENRTVMIKSDSSGSDSAIIDPYGRIAARALTPQGGETILIADVALSKVRAPAVFLGDWIGWLSLIGMILFSLPL